MRFVHPARVEERLSSEWRREARTAYEEVEGVNREARAQAINQRAKVWGDLKDILRDVSHGKCWYCESRDDRSDNAVDHFRPKNRVAETDAMDGYWWLAFDWSNYRFSCTFCNSYRKSHGVTGGKQDHFPLVDENKRAMAPGDRLEDEEPLLLDPATAGDSFLLSFSTEEVGEAVPRSGDKNDEDYKRARESITRYHLNQTRLVSRRRTLMLDIRRKVRDTEEHYRNRKDDRSAKKSYRQNLAQLLAATREDAEYSSATRVMLNSLRGESIVAELVVSR